MYDYCGLRALQIKAFFPGSVPCWCHDDSSKIHRVPRCDVRIRYGSTVCENRGRIISEITVYCDCCGASRHSNVERHEVYEKDISW